MSAVKHHNYRQCSVQGFTAPFTSFEVACLRSFAQENLPRPKLVQKMMNTVSAVHVSHRTASGRPVGQNVPIGTAVLGGNLKKRKKNYLQDKFDVGSKGLSCGTGVFGLLLCLWEPLNRLGCLLCSLFNTAKWVPSQRRSPWTGEKGDTFPKI